MITIQLRAGMWNQMFEYAFGKALAKKYNTSLNLDLKYLQDHWLYKKILKETPRNYDINSFEIKDFDITNKSIHNYALWPFGEMRNFLGKIYNNIYQKIVWLPIIREEKYRFDAKYFDNWPEQYLIWYRQSYKYFESINEELKEEFVPKEELSDKSKKLLEQIKNCESVCVNMRKSDYVNDPIFYVQDNSYYQEWIKIIQEKLWKGKDIKIFVFSDDVDRCRDNIKFDNIETIYVDKEYAWPKYTHYMRLMWHGKHFVWANSTFCRRSIRQHRNPEKIVILPKNWFVSPEMSVEDLIPDYRKAIRI